jgi:hypothetical protein
MKIIAILLILTLYQAIHAATVHSITNEMPAIPISFASNLKFENMTGKGATKEMIDSFITFAQYSSSVYRDDIEKTVKFIKYRMDERYGRQNDNFYIYIQTDQTIDSRYFWVEIDGVYASLSGINPIYPKWTYLFQRSYGSNKIVDYNFFTKGQKGKGIDQSLEKVIQTLILANEVTDTCQCTKELAANIGKGIL